MTDRRQHNGGAVYGLVAKALASLTVDRVGEQRWHELCGGLEVDDTFVGMRAYPDEVLLRLVDRVSVELECSVDEVLRLLGRHWIEYTAQEGWGPLLRLLGPDLVSALRSLDGLHVRVGLVLPELRPPSFEVTDVDELGLRLQYRSERQGLEAMVVGLIEALGEMFGTPVHVAPEGEGAFAVRFLAMAPAEAGVA